MNLGAGVRRQLANTIPRDPVAAGAVAFPAVDTLTHPNRKERGVRSKRRIQLGRLSQTALLVGIAALAASMLSLGAASASAASTTRDSQSVSMPSPVNLAGSREYSHTFRLHHNGTTITETCVGDTDIGKSTAYPGFIEGRAWVEGCTPDPAEFCSQTADMQTYDRYTHTWVADGDGTPKDGCAGVADAGTIRKDCHATEETFYYRTYGIFVAIDDLGDKLVWDGPSGQIGVLRVC
jgi:hypothetical protein